MSGRLVADVLEHAPEDLPPAAMLVLLSLAESARDKDRTARFHCSTTDLARRTRLTPGTVRNTIAQLRKRGLIRPIHANVHKGGKHQEYEIARLSDRHRFATMIPLPKPKTPPVQHRTEGTA